MLNKSANTLGAFLRFDLSLTFHRLSSSRINLVVRHPPSTAIASGYRPSCLMLMEPFNQVIALSNIKTLCGQALKDVNEVHKK